MGHDLLQSNVKVWNTNLISSRFYPVKDVAKVTSIPLFASILRPTTEFGPLIFMTFISIRVCIYFVLIKFLAPSHLRLSSKWSSIRKVKTPLKVHNLCRCTCRNVFPTRAGLRIRGMQCLCSCVILSLNWRMLAYFCF
jgi:hypothetical protein